MVGIAIATATLRLMHQTQKDSVASGNLYRLATSILKLTAWKWFAIAIALYSLSIVGMIFAIAAFHQARSLV